MTEQPDDVLTLAEAADYLKVSISTMQRLVKARAVTSVRIGRTRRISRKALAIFLTNLEKEARCAK